jgi:hypothetical protein
MMKPAAMTQAAMTTRMNAHVLTAHATIKHLPKGSLSSYPLTSVSRIRKTHRSDRFL